MKERWPEDITGSQLRPSTRLMENQRRLTVENDEKVKMDEIETNEKVEIDYGEISTTGRWTENLGGGDNRETSKHNMKLSRSIGLCLPLS